VQPVQQALLVQVVLLVPQAQLDLSVEQDLQDQLVLMVQQEV
jgi:hypothetical protein